MNYLECSICFCSIEIDYLNWVGLVFSVCITSVRSIPYLVCMLNWLIRTTLYRLSKKIYRLGDLQQKNWRGTVLFVWRTSRDYAELLLSFSFAGFVLLKEAVREEETSRNSRAISARARISVNTHVEDWRTSTFILSDTPLPSDHHHVVIDVDVLRGSKKESDTGWPCKRWSALTINCDMNSNRQAFFVPHFVNLHVSAAVRIKHVLPKLLFQILRISGVFECL